MTAPESSEESWIYEYRNQLEDDVRLAFKQWEHSPEHELEKAEAYYEMLREELRQVESRINELEADYVQPDPYEDDHYGEPCPWCGGVGGSHSDDCAG